MNEAYRVTARWVAEPRKIPILNIIGQTEQSENPGYAVFRIRGKEMRLYPIIEEPGAKELFYIFRDLTSGKRDLSGRTVLLLRFPEGRQGRARFQ